jgi:hypothetical protein
MQTLDDRGWPNRSTIPAPINGPSSGFSIEVPAVIE